MPFSSAVLAALAPPRCCEGAPNRHLFQFIHDSVSVSVEKDYALGASKTDA